jgi:hypothetical protein
MCDLKPKCRNAKSKSHPPPRPYTHTLQTSINYTIQQPDGYKDTTITNIISSTPPRASWFGRWVETGEMEPEKVEAVDESEKEVHTTTTSSHYTLDIEGE